MKKNFFVGNRLVNTVLSLPACLMARVGWAGLLVSSFIVGVCVWSLLVRGMPIGAFFWDLLTFEGAIYAVDLGHQPVVDFSATMVLPIYMAWFATKLNPLGWFFAWSSLQGLVAVILAFPVLQLRFTDKLRPWLYFLLFIFAVVPFNLSTGSAYPDYLNLIYYNGIYNRLCMVLIAILMMMFAPCCDNKPRRWWIAQWLSAAIILLVLFFTKISSFYIGVVIFLVIAARYKKSFLRDGGWIWSIIFLLLLASVNQFVIAYLRMLHSLSGNKLTTLFSELGSWRQETLMTRQAVESSVVVVAIAVIISSVFIAKGSRIALGLYVTFFFLCLFAFLAFSLTSYGDLGLTMAIFPLLVLAQYFRPSWQRSVLTVCVGVLILNYIAAFSVNTYKALPCHVNLLNTSSDIINSEYYACKTTEADVLSPDYYKAMTAHAKRSGERFSYLGESDYRFYLTQIAKAAEHLKTFEITPKTRVFALTFPAFYPAFLTKTDTPTQSRPWLLTLHEIFPETFGRGMPALINDSDYVLVERCFIQDNNIFLRDQFYAQMLGRFHKVGSTDCYDFFKLTSP